jgi:hypothetical protein
MGKEFSKLHNEYSSMVIFGGKRWCQASFGITSIENAFFRDVMDVMLCGSCKNILTTATWHNIPKDGILHSHHCGNLKSCIELTGWAL